MHEDGLNQRILWVGVPLHVSDRIFGDLNVSGTVWKHNAQNDQNYLD